MRRFIGASAGALALLVSLFAAPMTSAAAAPTIMQATSPLTEQGQMAIDDLRACVASSDVLNVYYLIDNSQSLRVTDDDKPGTDPDGNRVEILANSLEQLGDLRAGLTVKWAAGIFSDDFKALLPFAEVGARGADALSTALRKEVPNGYTNWPAGLKAAQQALQSENTSGACQLLISLTDSQIDISSPDGVDAKDFAALDDLCNGVGTTYGGIFDEFRQSGVVVIGALVGPDASATPEGQTLEALIEGSNDNGRTCGTNPVPEEAPWVHGAFIPANEFDSLARVFQALGAEVSGGSECWDSADPLWIDPGVARFRVIGGGDWTLTPPENSGFDGVLTSTAGEADAPDWASEKGAGSFDVDTSSQEVPGEWLLTDAISPQVYCFSDLSITFDDSTRIPLGEGGDSTGTIKAQLTGPAGMDLRNYEYKAAVQFAGPSNEAAPDWRVDVDAETGQVEITLIVPAENTSSQFDMALSLNSLRTKDHGLPLASVLGSQVISVDLPAEFPSIVSAMSTSALAGKNGQAKIELTVNGPTVAGTGKVCVPEIPVVHDDLADDVRGDTWDWGEPPECVDVPSGESKTIELAVTNVEPADSTVQATVGVTLTSTEGEERSLEVPFTFQTTHPVNPWAIIIIALALLTLGVLLPLVALWILNRRTTRLDIDQSIQRAALPVRMTSDGAIIEAPASDTALSERFTYRGAARGVSSIDDPDLGRISAVVPWFPLLAPSYRVLPGDGRVVVAARTGARGASTADRRRDGSLQFSQLPFEAFWAIVVSRGDLLTTKGGDELRGTAVLYHAQTASGPAQYRERLSAISHDTTIARSVEKLREQLREDEGRNDSKRPAGGIVAGSPPAVRSTSDGPPTPPNPGSGDPTRPPAPSRSGAGPARPGSVPSSPGGPPRPGSAPPRPGSTPAPPSAGGQPPRPSR